MYAPTHHQSTFVVRNKLFQRIKLDLGLVDLSFISGNSTNDHSGLARSPSS